jgi:transcription elongation factor GreA
MRARMGEDIPMSEQGLAELRAELHELETVARPRIADEIRTARDFGDLKENAEYHEAKRAQGHLETRIARLNEQLRHAVVVESSGDAAVVGFGSRVAVRDEASEREATYTLVGMTEARASAGALSIESPVARALLGARAGDVVKVTTPRGARELRVLSISVP